MRAHIELGDFKAEVIRKAVKNVHLGVYPPDGRVRIAAPTHLGLDTIRVFAISRLAWIKAERRKFLAQDRETPREYIERESHHVWGRRYLLTVRHTEAAAQVELQRTRLVLHVRATMDAERRAAILERWYRDQLRQRVAELLPGLQRRMGVTANNVFVQRMKTKWGGCNSRNGNIRLNTELAKKPPNCLEYVLVHELAHLIVPRHNGQFVDLMDRFYPNWRVARRALNALPLRHEAWVAC